MLQFTVPGKIVPYVRMTQRSKFSQRAQRYLTNQGYIRSILQLAMNINGQKMLPENARIAVKIIFNTSQYNCDIDNLTKAIFDAAQGAVYANDMKIDDMTVRRRYKSGEPKTEISFWVIDD